MSQCHDDAAESDPPRSFAGHLVRALTGGALTMLISLGYRTGLFEAAAAGPGAMWGTELAGQMLARAGFGQVELLDSPWPQNCIFVCHPDKRKPRAGNHQPEITGRKPLARPRPQW
jgi:hypothetical protein